MDPRIWLRDWTLEPFDWLERAYAERDPGPRTSPSARDSSRCARTRASWRGSRACDGTA